MKHINIAIENELHKRKQDIKISWANVLEAGIRIVELCGSWKEYQKLIRRFDDVQKNNARTAV